MTNTQVVNPALAAKHDEELAKLEEELLKAQEPIEDKTLSAEGEQKQEEKTPESESAPDDQKPLSETETKPEESAETPEEEEVNDEELSHQLSEKAQKRFRKLAEEAKRAKELEQELTTLKQSQSTQTEELNPSDYELEVAGLDFGGQSGLPWEQDKQPKEISVEDYTKHVADAARKVVQAELSKEKILSQLKTDVDEAEKLYPEFNPQASNFNSDLTQKIANWYKAQVRQNRNLRFLDFAKDVMSLRQQGVEQGKKDVQNRLSQQESEQALSPSGAPGDKMPTTEQSMRNARSIEELEKAAELLPHS